MNCTIRMTEEHLSEIAALETEVFSEPWSENALRLLLTQDAVGYVCVENGRILGYGGMLYAPGEGQITNIAVLPEARRRGVARKLLAALTADAAEHGAEQISLEVRASNEAAIALYEADGYTVAGRRRHFYRRPNEDALVMIRPLTAV